MVKDNVDIIQLINNGASVEEFTEQLSKLEKIDSFYLRGCSDLATRKKCYNYVLGCISSGHGPVILNHNIERFILAGAPDGYAHVIEPFVIDIIDSNKEFARSYHLNEAVDKNFINITRRLLDAGITKGYRDESVLHAAAKKGYKEMAQLLIDRGFRIDAKNEEEMTPAECSALEGYTEVLELFLSSGTKVSEWNQDNGRTLLHYAAISGNGETVEMLMDRGADPNAKDNSGNTPLHLAVSNGNTEIIRLLIGRGASINLPNSANRTPLYWAVSREETEAARLLIAAGAKVNPSHQYGQLLVHEACEKKSFEMLQILIVAGAELDTKDKDKRTPLHVAVFYNKSDYIKIIIESGASINDKDKEGNTALHSAIYWDRTEIAKFLLSVGAKTNIKNKKGLNPVDMAISRGRVELASDLILGGANYGKSWFSKPKSLSWVIEKTGENSTETRVIKEAIAKVSREPAIKPTKISGAEQLRQLQELENIRMLESVRSLLDNNNATVSGQKVRLESLVEALTNVTGLRFGENSLTYNKYISTVSVAQKEILINLKQINVLTVSLEALLLSKKDFKDILESKKSIIAGYVDKNEELIEELNNLLIKLVEMESEATDTRDIKEDIKTLTKQIDDYSPVR